MTERIETIIHWNAGQPVKAIVQSLGIARNTVRKYVRLAIRSGLRQGDPLPSREALVEILDRPESRTSFESPTPPPPARPGEDPPVVLHEPQKSF